VNSSLRDKLETEAQVFEQSKTVRVLDIAAKYESFPEDRLNNGDFIELHELYNIPVPTQILL
jgi:hypothetical protein